jgi:hypothetical protein
MIAKKIFRLVLILLLTGVVFTLGFWLINEIKKYGGTCDAGDWFTNYHVYQCGLREYLTNDLFWLSLLFVVVGIYWVPGTLVIALAYWAVLSFRKNKQLPQAQRNYPVYTFLGIITGLVLAVFLPIFNIFRHFDKFRLIYTLILLLAPIAMGIVFDRKKNKTKTSNDGKTPN